MLYPGSVVPLAMFSMEEGTTGLTPKKSHRFLNPSSNRVNEHLEISLLAMCLPDIKFNSDIHEITSMWQLCNCDNEYSEWDKFYDDEGDVG